MANRRLLDLNNIEEKTEHNAKVISCFMDHCKKEGIEIPEHCFESFFDA